MSWRDEGLCVQTDPDVFFDDSDDGIAAAKSICADCTVRETDCLTDALSNGNADGVQAGLTYSERVAHPGFARAQPVAAFAPPTDEELSRRWQAQQDRLARRAAAEANRRESHFDDLTHPLDRDRKAIS